MRRPIVDFEVDGDGHWFARLECGHSQHVRHHPPLQSRPWVLTEEGRASKLGCELDCQLCHQPQLPDGLVVYKLSKSFDQYTVPQGLLRAHYTRDGVWARIVVESGLLRYTIEEQQPFPPGIEAGTWHLRPGVIGTVAPGIRHHVEPLGPTVFHLEFLRHEQPSATRRAT